jgi:hypothetical protein
MKKLFLIALTALLALPVLAADKEKDKAAKAKPYPLKGCLVTDEPLSGTDMTPYTFVHEGREVKLCCKSCLKDFKKETAKYVKKMEAAEKK